MKYGFIGVGNMGHFMAANCMKAGYEMVVSNTHAKEAVAELAKQGAETVDTNGQVAEKAEIIFLCLPNGDVVESVIEELLDAENSIVKEIYDFSTIAPTMSQKLGKEGKENGYKYYDCPIAGGVAGAEAATLSIMVGCDESEFDHVKEVVAPMGKNIMYAGVTGSGSAVKMFNNYLGLRPYVNIDGRAGITGISANGIDQNQGNTNARVFGSASLGFNVDMLANFYVNESRTFHAGGILGVGVGGGYGGFAAAESDGAAQRANAEGSYGTFGHFHLNVGLKATWNRKHGLEVLARIPLAAWGSGERVQGNLDSAGNSQSNYSNNRPYSNGTAIFVMYAYSI